MPLADSKDLFSAALSELNQVTSGIDPDSIEAACSLLLAAKKIVVYGCGREGLQLRGFAMRLYHLGLDVAMQGDMAAPPVGPEDLFVTSAGPGELSTVTALMKVARAAGAPVLFLTAEPGAAAADLADHVLTIPAQTMARDQGGDATSILPMGSLYEGAMFLLFEVMILRMSALTGTPPDAMRARHTNLE